MKVREKLTQMHIRFTEKGFLVDDQEGEYIEEIVPGRERFESDKWKAVYLLGFEKKPEWLDAAAAECKADGAEGADEGQTHGPRGDSGEKHCQQLVGTGLV